MRYVKLTYEEQALAIDIGAQRYSSNRTSGTVDRRRDALMTEVGPDEWGMMGEMGFAKLMGIEPDLNIAPRQGTTDFVIGGIGIDVKATPRKRGQLIATPSKVHCNDSDVYVLAIVNCLMVSFPGWAMDYELLNPSRKTDLGRGPTYALRQEELRPIETLIADLSPFVKS